MIKTHCFTKDWILRQRRRYTRVDPTLLEKTILAFELLGRLAKNRLVFVFKGGTCLLLLLERMKRVSIDIDIMCDERQDKMAAVFDTATSNVPFYRWEEDARTTSNIPKKHYKFSLAILGSFAKMLCSRNLNSYRIFLEERKRADF